MTVARTELMIKYGLEFLNSKMSRHRELVDYYNKHCAPLVSKDRRYLMSLNDNWCAMFLSVLAHKAGFNPDEFPFEVSVYFMAKGAKENGNYVEGFHGASRGDLLVYDWNSGNRYNHIGIITDVKANNMQVLEGNFRGGIGIRSFTPNRRLARGYITLTRSKKGLHELALATIRGEYGNGEQRKAMLGNRYNDVQKLVNEMI